MKTQITKIIGKVVSLVVPGRLLFLTKLGNQYAKNPYHRSNEGDILISTKANVNYPKL